MHVESPLPPIFVGHSVRFADMPGKSRKRKKNMKELTPLQAMMLRMAGKQLGSLAGYQHWNLYLSSYLTVRKCELCSKPPSENFLIHVLCIKVRILQK